MIESLISKTFDNFVYSNIFFIIMMFVSVFDFLIQISNLNDICVM